MGARGLLLPLPEISPFVVSRRPLLGPPLYITVLYNGYLAELWAPPTRAHVSVLQRIYV